MSNPIKNNNIVGFLAVVGVHKELLHQHGIGAKMLAERVGNFSVDVVELGNLALFYWTRSNTQGVKPRLDEYFKAPEFQANRKISFLFGQVYDDISALKSEVEQWSGLNGRYAWISWEQEKSRFTATSDFLGIRALYYLENKDLFLITNEPSTLLGSPSFTGDLDPAGCVDMLQKGCCLGDRTVFKQIRFVPPGATIIRESETTKIKRRSVLPIPIPSPISGDPDDLADELWILLKRSIDRRIADVKNWHVLLSGGLDSRVCAGLLNDKAVLGGLFNWGSRKGGDSRVPAKLARSLGMELKEVVIPPNHLKSYHSDLVGLNACLTNAHITYLISAMESLSKERFPLVIGYSGDPLTGGHVPFETPSGNANPSLEESVDHFHGALGRFFSASELPNYLMDTEWLGAIDASKQEIKKVMDAAESPHHYQRWIAALLWCRQLRYTTFLPRICDNFSPTFSPFEDKDVFQFCLALPPEALKGQIVYRRMISRHLPDLAKHPRSDGSYVEPTILQKKTSQVYKQIVARMPERLRWRLDWWSGGGYSVDPNADLRTGSAGYLREFVAKHEKWEKHFNSETTTQLLDDFLSGKRSEGFQVQSLVTLLEAMIRYHK